MTAGGDLFSSFKSGTGDVRPGSVYLVNATAGTIRTLEVSGKDAPKLLVSHGIHFSQRTRRLYVVNHDMAQGESVEIFAVADDETLAITHVARVQSPLFKHFAERCGGGPSARRVLCHGVVAIRIRA